MVDLTRDEARAGARTPARPGARPIRAGLPRLAHRAGRDLPRWDHDRDPRPVPRLQDAIDDQLADAVAVLDAFHVVKLATAVVDDVRRRVQQETTGHRGRREDPLYRVRNILRAGQEHLSERQEQRLRTAFTAREEHLEVEVAYRCAQQVRSCFHQNTHAAGRRLAEKVLATLPSCPIPEVARLGRTLTQWRAAFLGYFDTQGASNGGTEAVNGLIELHRRMAGGFRNRGNYRLRMLLIAGGLHP